MNYSSKEIMALTSLVFTERISKQNVYVYHSIFKSNFFDLT